MIKAYAKSDIGKVREINQDSYYISDSLDEVQLYMLADGMGGCQGGEIASKLAIQSAKNYIENNFKEIEKDKKCTFNAKMIMGTGSTAINLNSENEIELGVEMPKVDVSGAKSVDEMTEEQREAYNNIYDILNFSEIDDNDDEFNDYIFED